jgi:hypothetical protein
MLTPQLVDWQLGILRGFWVRYDRLGKKWAKADVPQHLYDHHTPDTIDPSQSASTSQPRQEQSIPRASSSRAVATATTSTTLKRKRSEVTPPPMRTSKEILDLTSSPPKKRRAYIWVDEIDLC